MPSASSHTYHSPYSCLRVAICPYSTLVIKSLTYHTLQTYSTRGFSLQGLTINLNQPPVFPLVDLFIRCNTAIPYSTQFNNTLRGRLPPHILHSPQHLILYHTIDFSTFPKYNHIRFAETLQPFRKSKYSNPPPGYQQPFPAQFSHLPLSITTKQA